MIIRVRESQLSDAFWFQRSLERSERAKGERTKPDTKHSPKFKVEPEKQIKFLIFVRNLKRTRPKGKGRPMGRLNGNGYFGSGSGARFPLRP